MEMDSNLVEAERLDRPVQHHLPPLDGEAAFADRRGDVAGRDRAVELAVVARLADDDEVFSVELPGDALGVGLALKVVRLKLSALALEAFAVGVGGAKCLAAREEKVAGVAVLDRDDVTHLANAANALQQNDLHDRCSYSCLLYTSPSPRDRTRSRMPSSA